MDAREVTRHDTEVVPLGPSCTRTLEVLQDAERALGAHDIAALVGLHVNSVRFHLDGLVEAGLASSAPRPADAALEAGRAWGRYLTEAPAPFKRLGAEEPALCLAYFTTTPAPRRRSARTRK